MISRKLSHGFLDSFLVWALPFSGWFAGWPCFISFLFWGRVMFVFGVDDIGDFGGFETGDREIYGAFTGNNWGTGTR